MRLCPSLGVTHNCLGVLWCMLQAESLNEHNGGKQNGHRDKYAPGLTWEDGTVLYTSDLLEGSSYEDLLHS